MDKYAIVSVRYSSTRLPGKALLPVVDGLTAIECVIQRALLTGLPVILATSTDRSDDPFEAICERWGIAIFRGALLNKLLRWRVCFERFGIEAAAMVDGDDLLWNPAIGLRALERLTAAASLDLVENPEEEVCGFFTYALHRRAFAKLAPFAQDENLNTDVIAAYLEHAGVVKEQVALEPWERDRPFRLTLDYPEDLAMFQALIGAVGVRASGLEVIDWLEAHPEVAAINRGRHQEFLDNQLRFTAAARAALDP